MIGAKDYRVLLSNGEWLVTVHDGLEVKNYSTEDRLMANTFHGPTNGHAVAAAVGGCDAVGMVFYLNIGGEDLAAMLVPDEQGPVWKPGMVIEYKQPEQEEIRMRYALLREDRLWWDGEGWSERDSLVDEEVSGKWPEFVRHTGNTNLCWLRESCMNGMFVPVREVEEQPSVDITTQPTLVSVLVDLVDAVKSMACRREKDQETWVEQKVMEMEKKERARSATIDNLYMGHEGILERIETLERRVR